MLWGLTSNNDKIIITGDFRKKQLDTLHVVIWKYQADIRGKKLSGGQTHSRYGKESENLCSLPNIWNLKYQILKHISGILETLPQTGKNNRIDFP